MFGNVFVCRSSYGDKSEYCVKKHFLHATRIADKPSNNCMIVVIKCLVLVFEYSTIEL